MSFKKKYESIIIIISHLYLIHWLNYKSAHLQPITFTDNPQSAVKLQSSKKPKPNSWNTWYTHVDYIIIYSCDSCMFKQQSTEHHNLHILDYHVGQCDTDMYIFSQL